MTARRTTQSETKQTRRPPARTPEDRENQLIALATDLAEQQIRAGTASSQVISHFLKMGSTSEKLGQAYKEEEIKLLKIKGEMIASQRRHEELMTDALQAFKAYSGQTPDPEDDYAG